ncbi:MAG: Holliday junction branch migration protein RuvA [Deltaproteobacteria bacterium]|nr:Holliday junction branch migration protein RuvA [Deltaproteobacteria bacterium]MCL5277821.1 Holliday junction branch migration protein RuvA [Deltaproteobacteria bacterium]
MLYHIKGTLVEKRQDSVVVEVNGIGFEVFVSSITLLSLPEEGSSVMLYLHTHAREEDIYLYGFATVTEKELFKLLISVSGIGPRAARNMLSNIRIDELIGAVVTRDAARLSSVPGIGRKSAEKIILELKEKMDRLKTHAVPATARQAILSDTVSALVNLGYKSQQSRDVVEDVVKENPSLDIQGIIRLSLKRLST